MNKKPRISIVTPVYNCEQYIEKCIQSILSQEYYNYEHIIMDGGSTDGTVDILRKYQDEYPMKWISEPDNGMYDAINKGFQTATGDIYAWINADDCYYPWTFEIVAKVFEKKEIQWLIGMPSNIKSYDGTDVTYLSPNLPPVFNRKMIQKGVYDGIRLPFIQQESCFWTRQLWERSGGVDIKYKLAGDYHLWKKFAEKTTLYTVHCSLAGFRIHDHQKSGDFAAYHREVGTKKPGKLEPGVLLAWSWLYSLKNYRKYVINIEQLFLCS